MTTFFCDHYLCYNDTTFLIRGLSMNFVITNVRKIYNEYYNFPENMDMFDGRLPFSDYLMDGEDKVILSLVDKKIIGFCLLHEDSPGYWVKLAVSVDSQYRRQGVAKKMLTLAHQFIIQKNAKMLHGIYSEEGNKFLHKINMQFQDTYAKI